MDVDDLDDATLVAGAPRSGKTRFALDMLVAAMKRHGDAYAVMTVSGRQVADRLGDTVIRELSAISQARPVTTLPAVAFRIMTAVRSHAGQPLPKLLNGGRTGCGHPPRARQACRTCRARRRMLHLRAIAHLLRGRRLVGHGGGRRHRRLRQPAARHACPHERDRRETGTRRHADRPRCRRTRHARRTTRTTARANGGSPSRCAPNTTRPSTRHIRTNTVSTPRSS